MSTAAAPVALEDFLANPDIHYYDFHELHNGEIVEVSPPSIEHVRIQSRLEELFRSIVPAEYTVWREFYYTLPTESRRADVAVVLESRHTEQPPRKAFFGAPDIIVEVFSESNTAADLAHLRRVCLAEHTEQFWIVDPFEKVVEIYHRNGDWKEYRQEATIRFHFAGNDLEMRVAPIFG